MNLTELRVASVLGFVVVGLVTTIGAVVARASEVEGRGAKVSRTQAVDASFRLDAADHALLARQAWWRLRC